MERLGVGALLLRKPANLAWYTNGADNRVDHSAPLGVASLLVTGDAEYVVADNIEADRMRAQEYGGLEVVEHPWHEAPTPTVRRLMGHSPLGTDHSLEGPQDVSGEVAPLRYALDDDAIKRYRRDEADTTAAMEEAADAVDPGVGEEEIAANLLFVCRRRGFSVPVVLAAADERIASYRHPNP